MTDIQFNRKNRINCFLPSARRNVGAAQKLSKLSLYNITYQIPKLALIAGTFASASATAFS